MTDLHTHILPGMDDGPKDTASALALLELQLQQGVRNLALTSHFCCDIESPEAFLARRSRAFSELRDAAPEGISLKQGAEVFFTPELFYTDVRMLCLEGTNYLLLELPILQKPPFLEEYLMHLRSQGIIPLIAHAERYVYIQRNPVILTDWIANGALIQVNSGSLTGDAGKFVCKLIKWGLVHVLASDAHSADHRPPDLRRGLQTAAHKIGSETVRELARNAECIYSGQDVRPSRFHTPKRFFGFWI